MAFLGKKMGNNHLHYIQAIFISKKHFRAGENFVVFWQCQTTIAINFAILLVHISDKLPCSTFCTFKSEPLSIFQNQLLVTVAGADIFSRSDAKISSWYKTALLLKFTIQAHSHVSLLFYCCFVNCDAFLSYCFSLLLASKYLYAGLSSDQCTNKFLW